MHVHVSGSVRAPHVPLTPLTHALGSTVHPGLQIEHFGLGIDLRGVDGMTHQVYVHNTC